MEITVSTSRTQYDGGTFEGEKMDRIMKLSFGKSVDEHPSLVRVYMKCHVDFFCGGARSVQEVLESSFFDFGYVQAYLKQGII